MREGVPGAIRQRGAGWAKISALVLAAVVGILALTVTYFLFYPNALKPIAVYAVERLLDRQLVIDGDLAVDLSRMPRVTVSQARFSNPPGSPDPWMATADHASARIDLPGLFEKRFRLLELTARGARLTLYDAVDGAPNWQFFEPSGQGADWSFMIERLSIADSEIELRLGELAPILLTVPTLEELGDVEGHLTLNGNGLINGDPWRVEGRIGPLSELLAAGRIDLDMALTLDKIVLDAVGSIGELATLSSLDLGIRLRGPDAELLGEIFRMPEAFSGDVDLEAAIRPDPAGHQLGVQGHVSQFFVEADGTIADLKNLDGWDGSVALHGPDAGVFGKAFQIKGFPDGPFQVAGSMHLHGGDVDLKNVVVNTDDARLRIDADFEKFPRREGALAALSLAGDDLSEFRTLLRLPELPPTLFELALKLDATSAEALTSTLTVGENRLTATGAIGEYPDFHGTDLAVSIEGADIASITQAFGLPLPLQGAYQGESRLMMGPDGLALRQSSIELPGQMARGDLLWPDPLKPDSLIFQGSLALSDLAQTAALFGVSGLPADPIVSTGTLDLEEGFITIRESRTELSSAAMTVQGSIGQPGTLADLNLAVDLAGPSLEALFDDAVSRDGNPLPFSVHAEIQGMEDALQLRTFRLETSGGTFDAQGKLALGNNLIGSALTLNGSGPNLSDIVPAFPGYRPPDAPWRLEAAVELPDVDHLRVSNGILDIGTAKLRVDGLLDSADQTRTNLRFSVKGDRLADLGNISDIAWPDHPFEVTADLNGTRNSLEVQTLEAHWGESDLTGTGKVLFGERPYVEIRGNSKLLDIYDLQQALFGAGEEPQASATSEKIFPDTPISLDAIAGIDGLLDVHVDHFRGQRSRLEDIELDLKVKDGVLRVDRVALRDTTGYFHASAVLQPAGEQVQLDLQFKGEDADLGLFVTENQAPDTIPRYTLDVDIWGSGRTVAELAGSLNGRLLVSSAGGQISNLLLQAYAGDFLTNVLETMNPFVRGEEFTRMDCLVLNGLLTDGKLKLEPGFVMRTARLNMFVYGGANLANETLDLSLATQARQGIGISAASITNPYFKVGGTFAAPALQLDPASAAIAASVATATAGLSILIRGFFDRLKGSQNPCPNFLNYEQTLPERPANHPAPEAGGTSAD